jgi:hypothetical protein
MTAAPVGPQALFFNCNAEGGTDMNCRFATIDARITSVTRSLVNVQTLTGMALQHCPGEGTGGSS